MLLQVCFSFDLDSAYATRKKCALFFGFGLGGLSAFDGRVPFFILGLGEFSIFDGHDGSSNAGDGSLFGMFFFSNKLYSC
jgi:hypothetical protein